MSRQEEELVLTQAELPPEIAARLEDETIDVHERLELARRLAAEYGEVAVYLKKWIVSDGQGYDKGMPEEELLRLYEELGFDPQGYEEINMYEWHTKSTKHPDLMIRVRETGIEIGGATELFPNGIAWSQYDNISTCDLVVFPTLPTAVPSPL